MTPQEKGPYEKMAKDAKVTNTYNNAGERYTAQGNVEVNYDTKEAKYDCKFISSFPKKVSHFPS